MNLRSILCGFVFSTLLSSFSFATVCALEVAEYEPSQAEELGHVERAAYHRNDRVRVFDGEIASSRDRLSPFIFLLTQEKESGSEIRGFVYVVPSEEVDVWDISRIGVLRGSRRQHGAERLMMRVMEAAQARANETQREILLTADVAPEEHEGFGLFKKMEFKLKRIADPVPLETSDGRQVVPHHFEFSLFPQPMENSKLPRITGIRRDFLLGRPKSFPQYSPRSSAVSLSFKMLNDPGEITKALEIERLNFAEPGSEANFRRAQEPQPSIDEQTPRYLGLVAYANGSQVGQTLLRYHGETVSVIRFAILPGYFSCGVENQMIRELKKEIRDGLHTHIEIHIHRSDQRLLGIFRQNGFRIIGYPDAEHYTLSFSGG